MKRTTMLALGLLLVWPPIPGCDSERATGTSQNLAQVTLTAKPVTTLPSIDGDASDAAWASAPALDMAVLTMKAVYTSTELALLMVWEDRDLSMNTRGTWSYQPISGTWSQTGMTGRWESFTGQRHPEWVDVAFDISSKIKTQGCNAFCHESPTGSGAWHHNTEVKGEYVDSWLLLAKHGYGSKYYNDMGWLAGVDGVTQTGTPLFDTSDTLDSHQLIAGKVTFLGYGEDKFMTSLTDNAWPRTDRPADQYCIKCHTELKASDWTKTENRTYGDDGEIAYTGNWNTAHTAPLYMERSPANFADAMVLTQAEIDAGEAVSVAGLSSSQISSYWARYAELNALVPQLVLKRPTGSQADVRVAATWNNGRWTVEIKRKLVTGSSDDVQFSSLSKSYYFTLSLWGHRDLIGPLAQPAVMRFGT